MYQLNAGTSRLHNNLLVAQHYGDARVCDEKHRHGNGAAAKVTVWAKRLYERAGFDDGAAGGIFGVADPKLCFYSYRRASSEWVCKSALMFVVH